MHIRIRTLLVTGSLTALVFSLTLPVPTKAGTWRKLTSVDRLAVEIDKLERHIDEYGSIVAKHPDVWGQSRLMQHRYEYEQEMLKDLATFKDTLSAQVRQSDQAYLATATLIDSVAGQKSSASTSGLQTLIGDVTKTDNFSRSDPNADPKYGKFQIQGQDASVVGLEPTIYLDHKDRYLHHLHELRRINEGDDGSDSAGYALDVIRMPVSVLPGKRTREGYGAEITVTATPLLGDDILPTTFRTWVINDLVNQIGLPLTKAINNVELRNKKDVFKKIVALLDGEPIPINSDKESGSAKALSNEAPWMPTGIQLFESDCEGAQRKVFDWHERSWYDGDQHEFSPKLIYSDGVSPGGKSSKTEPAEAPTGPDLGIWGVVSEYIWKSQSDLVNKASEVMKKSTENAIANKVKSDLRGITMSTLIDAGVPRTRNSQFAFPLSQFSEVYGQGLLLRVAWEAYVRLGANPENTATGHVHFHDVEAYLNEELHAAYELLEAPGNEHLWQLCNQSLATAIRSRNRQEIIRIQEQFFKILNPDAKNTTTAAYAWAIIVEAALLNERLVRDVRETSTNRGCPCMLTEWMPFYLPDPPVEARETFKAYINCRWPIYTFALDPVIQEQNVGERFSRRREFQLALAVGVSTGQIAANQLSRFARRLELDMETIDLNRTITGFSHGNNQFGWRFTPRVQVPTVEGNLTVAFRDLLVGGPSRDCDLRRTRLEPGTRECIALVVRPSMIPRFVLDTRTNWFRLTDPKTTVMSLKSTVDLSRTIRGMQDCAAVCVQDAAAYRDGELHRVLRRVDQLSAELPLQTMHYDVPLENVLGGFRMFNGSSTDLSPQLYSWYGEPGIDVSQETTIFLTGERFSVQGTRVVVGNKSIGPGDYVEDPPKPADSKPKSDSPAATAANSATVTATVTAAAQTPGAASATAATSPAPASSGGAKPQTPRMELLSRRIMKVIIPANVRTYPGTNPNGKPQPYVDLHIATPYGVTQKLSIPVIEAPPAAKDIAKAIEDHEKKRHFDTFAWENKDVQATVQYNDATHHVSSFDFATKSVAIQKSAVSPRVTQPVGIEVAFWIAMKPKGKDKKPVQIRDASGKLVNAVVGPVRAMLGPDGTAVLSDRTKAQSDLADAILKIIGDSTGYAPFTSDDNIESLELDGFVRAVDGTPFGNQTPADGLPVVRLEDPLTIKLVTGKPASAVSAVTPFNQPSVQPTPAATPDPTTPPSPAPAPKESTPSNSMRSPESQPIGPNLGDSNASKPWPAAPQRVSAIPPGCIPNRRASAEVAFDRAGGKPMRNLSSPAARTMPVARQTRRSDTAPEIGSGAREIVPVEFTFDSRTGK